MKNTSKLAPGHYYYRMYLFDEKGDLLSENYEMMEFVTPLLKPGTPILG